MSCAVSMRATSHVLILCAPHDMCVMWLMLCFPRVIAVMWLIVCAHIVQTHANTRCTAAAVRGLPRLPRRGPPPPSGPAGRCRPLLRSLGSRLVESCKNRRGIGASERRHIQQNTGTASISECTGALQSVQKASCAGVRLCF